jgi:predicted HTH transcriptional regulator
VRELIDKALSSTSESRAVEFKAGLDPTSPGEWCELIKDLVAMANTGGGLVLIGVSDDGSPALAGRGLTRRTLPTRLPGIRVSPTSMWKWWR